MKPKATIEIIRKVIDKAREAINKKELLKEAQIARENRNHELHEYFNTYPALHFELKPSDLEEIQFLKNISKDFSEHIKTPLEKIFYAHLWKDKKLKPIIKIIEGAESALNDAVPSNGDKAVVYSFFGRHLVDRMKHPIIDQHCVRAHRLIVNEAEENITKIRKGNLPTQEEAIEYCEWFRNILEQENITNYKNSRDLDGYLFAIGKFSKINSN